MARHLTTLGLTMAIAAAASVFAGAAESEAERERLRQRRRTPVVEAVEKTRKAVVNISTTSRVVMSRSPFGFDSLFDEIFQRPVEKTSAGSGFLIHPSGYIVTNAHVVVRSTDNKIALADEPDGKAHSARVVTIDREHDLAVLKVDVNRRLPYLKLGRSADLMIGETVIVIGNPYGYHHTVTTGVLGALNRTLEFGSGVKYAGLIQTDAAINPGNSGGPLLNINGELIGIATAIHGDAENIGFAIPVDHLRRLLPEMLTVEIETHRRVQIGMHVSDQDVVRVTSVVDGSPAHQAGVQAGDVLRRVEGRPVSQAMDFYAEILEKKAGDVVTLAVQRGQQAKMLTMRLAEVPKPNGAKLALQRLGLQLSPMAASHMRQFGLREAVGLMVTGVDRNGPSYKAGIRRGDVLYQLGRYYGFADLDAVGQLLKDVGTGDVIYIGWLRSDARYVYQYNARLRAR